MQLSITPSREATGTVLTLAGSVDLVSKDELLKIGRQELARGDCSRLVLDLAEVTFIDSSGLGVLVTLNNEAEMQAAEVVVRKPSHRVDRLLDVSGLSSVFGREP